MPRAPLKLPSCTYLRECFLYKPTVGSLIWRERPRRHFPSTPGWQSFNRQLPGRVAGFLDTAGYRRITVNGEDFKASRIVWCIMTGTDPEDAQIDHVNGHPYDNRFANLRLATSIQNGQNRGAQTNNKSGYKGVSRSGKRWRAQIAVDGVTHNLGSFNTAEQASGAYLYASRQLHKPFVRES